MIAQIRPLVWSNIVLLISIPLHTTDNTGLYYRAVVKITEITQTITCYINVRIRFQNSWYTRDISKGRYIQSISQCHYSGLIFRAFPPFSLMDNMLEKGIFALIHSQKWGDGLFQSAGRRWLFSFPAVSLMIEVMSWGLEFLILSAVEEQHFAITANFTKLSELSLEFWILSDFHLFFFMIPVSYHIYSTEGE